MEDLSSRLRFASYMSFLFFLLLNTDFQEILIFILDLDERSRLGDPTFLLLLIGGLNLDLSFYLVRWVSGLAVGAHLHHIVEPAAHHLLERLLGLGIGQLLQSHILR